MQQRDRFGWDLVPRRRPNMIDPAMAPSIAFVSAARESPTKRDRSTLNTRRTFHTSGIDGAQETKNVEAQNPASLQVERANRAREVAVRSDWRHFDAEIQICPQNVDEELWTLVPELKEHKGKPFVWRFVPTPSGCVKMFVLCKLSSVELLKVRIGKGVANSLTKADFGDELAEECRPTTLSGRGKGSAVDGCDTPTRMRRQAKQHALERVGALRSAREAPPAVALDAAWAAQQGARKLAAAKGLQQPEAKMPSREPMNGTTGIFAPVDVDKWRETAVATFVGQKSREEEAAEIASQIGISVAKSDSKVSGWGAIRFGRRKGETVRNASSPVSVFDGLVAASPQPPVSQRARGMLASAI